MASSRWLRVKQANTITRKIPNGEMLRGTIVVGIPRKYVSIVY